MMEFEIVAYIAFLAFNILLAILFVKESRAFPRCFVAFIALSFIFVGVDHLIFSHAISGSSLQLQQRLQPVLQKRVSAMLPAAIAGLIWILYVVRSRRVKATFVN